MIMLSQQNGEVFHMLKGHAIMTLPNSVGDEEGIRPFVVP